MPTTSAPLAAAAAATEPGPVAMSRVRLPSRTPAGIEQRLDRFRRHRLEEVAVRASDAVVPLPFELPKRCRIDRPRGAPPSNDRPPFEDVVLAP